MIREKILVIASAGGHLTQAMCATSACDYIILVCNQKNIVNERIKKIYKIWDTQKNVLVHFFNLFFAFWVLIVERPKVVFSTGGPIVLPFALLCKIFRIRFIYLDTLSRVVELSNTGKLIKKYKLYNEFFCQWQNIAQKNDVQYIGKSFDILGENACEFESHPAVLVPTILVTVGTNHYDFERLFVLLDTYPLYHDKRVNWVIQANHNKVKSLPGNGTVVTMLSRDEMEALVKEASLVISHCGIGSINLMLAYQKKVVFVPRVAKFNEFSDDHQLQISNEIEGPLFDVVQIGHGLPELTFDELISQPILSAAVDTTNHAMAAQLKVIFFKNNTFSQEKNND